MESLDGASVEIDAQAIGTTLALEHGVSEGIAMIQQELVTLEQTVAATSASLETLTQLGAGLSMPGSGAAPVNVAGAAPRVSSSAVSEQSNPAALTRAKSTRSHEAIGSGTRPSRIQSASQPMNPAGSRENPPPNWNQVGPTVGGTLDVSVQPPASSWVGSPLVPPNAMTAPTLSPLFASPVSISPADDTQSLAPAASRIVSPPVDTQGVAPTAFRATAWVGLPNIDTAPVVFAPILPNANETMGSEETVGPERVTGATASTIYADRAQSGPTVQSSGGPVGRGEAAVSPLMPPAHGKGRGSTRLPEQPARHADWHHSEPFSEPREGTLILDGAQLGRWMIDHLARHASRPVAGATGVDPRISATYPGAPTGG